MDTNQYLNFSSTLNQVQIIPPGSKAVRARKVVTRSRARATGKFPSRKMNRMLQWESINELNAFRLLEANPNVISFTEQPFAISYVLNGATFYHFPDILFKTRCSKHLWEVKPRSKACHPDVVARTALMRSALPSLGYQYDLVIGEDLARKDRLTNVRKLLTRGRRDVPPLLREQIRQVFVQQPLLSIEALLDALGDLLQVGHIYRQILDGVLLCDLESPLSMQTTLSHVDSTGHSQF